jgi:hypothetical protein
MSTPPAVMRAIYAAKREDGQCVQAGCERQAMRGRVRCFHCLLTRATRRRLKYGREQAREAR